jgi:hypothetical protein
MDDLTIELDDRPGALAELGEVMYSDHDNCLILVVNDPDAAAAATTDWAP